MASFATACRFSAVVARRQLVSRPAVRGFRTCVASQAAQNFTMPALSPTMTEGNIAAWRVKEGEKFSAGDVLLEIETDKATMDVEAQEDGILMKIMQDDGAKAVKVGTRIAVLAEEGDDVTSLEIPAEEKSATQEVKGSSSSKEDKTPEQPREDGAAQKPSRKPTSSGKKAPKQTYPLYPSVAHLMKENGLDESAIGEMTPTGPNGRLLKGDVLAYLGIVNAEAPSELSTKLKKLGHLDLSNIKVAKAPEAQKPAKESTGVGPKADEATIVTLPISFAEVIRVQKKVQDTLGVFLPLSTFVSRAASLANDELPRAANAKVSADDLFNQVLGLNTVDQKVSRGFYLPDIAGVLPTPSTPPTRMTKKPDVIDVLAGRKSPKALRSPSAGVAGLSTGTNLFSLVVPTAEERRAQVFLERLKLVLENEPGRLVL